MEFNAQGNLQRDPLPSQAAQGNAGQTPPIRREYRTAAAMVSGLFHRSRTHPMANPFLDLLHHCSDRGLLRRWAVQGETIALEFDSPRLKPFVSNLINTVNGQRDGHKVVIPLQNLRAFISGIQAQSNVPKELKRLPLTDGHLPDTAAEIIQTEPLPITKQGHLDVAHPETTAFFRHFNPRSLDNIQRVECFLLDNESAPKIITLLAELLTNPHYERLAIWLVNKIPHEKLSGLYTGRDPQVSLALYVAQTAAQTSGSFTVLSELLEKGCPLESVSDGVRQSYVKGAALRGVFVATSEQLPYPPDNQSARYALSLGPRIAEKGYWWVLGAVIGDSACSHRGDINPDNIDIFIDRDVIHFRFSYLSAHAQKRLVAFAAKLENRGFLNLDHDLVESEDHHAQGRTLSLMLPANALPRFLHEVVGLGQIPGLTGSFFESMRNEMQQSMLQSAEDSPYRQTQHDLLQNLEAASRAYTALRPVNRVVARRVVVAGAGADASERQRHDEEAVRQHIDSTVPRETRLPRNTRFSAAPLLPNMRAMMLKMRGLHKIQPADIPDGPGRASRVPKDGVTLDTVNNYVRNGHILECPIGLEPLEVPVIVSSGVTYSYEGITTYVLGQEGNNVQDPVNRASALQVIPASESSPKALMHRLDKKCMALMRWDNSPGKTIDGFWALLKDDLGKFYSDPYVDINGKTIEGNPDDAYHNYRWPNLLIRSLIQELTQPSPSPNPEP